MAAWLATAALPARAGAPVDGLWLTQRRGGVVQLSDCGVDVCARIAGIILDHPDDPTPKDYRGVSQCHLPLIDDAHPVAANLWKGHITDPRDGDVYHVELHLDAAGHLILRGYLGIPLLGQSRTWTRYGGTVPADCRIIRPAPGK